MGHLFRELRDNWELIAALTRKELLVRYKRSLLGFLWALLNPLLTMAVLTLVFATIMRFPVEHYAVFVITALLPWTFFSQAVSYSTESIVGNGELLKKVAVAKSVFPVAAVLSNLVNFVLALLPLAVILLVTGYPLRAGWAYVPLAVVALTLFTLGCGLLFATANVFFRDVAHMIQVILGAWFYFSPVIYSLELVPEPYRWIFKLNPMLYLLSGFRDSIYHGGGPSPGDAALAFACGLVTLGLGYAVFRRYQESFVFYV